MARPQKKVARKDYPANGIKKGDTYWKVSLKTGPRSSTILRQLQPFKRAQLTTSSYYQQAYTISDETIPAISSMDDIDSLITEVESLRDECQEKLDNMPEGLQQGNTGQTLQERVDECEDFISSLQNIDTSLDDEDDVDLEEYESYEDYVGRTVDRAKDEVQEACPW